MHKLLKDKKFIFGILIISIFLFFAILSFFWTPNEFNKIYDDAILQNPSMQFPFGTDANGRCIMTRLMVSLRRVFLISTCSVVISISIGIIFGIISGYFNGKIDTIFYNLINIINSIPDILIVLVVISVFGTSNIVLILIIGLLGIAYPTRIIRGNVKKIKNSDHIVWAKSIGCSNIRVLFHIMPELLPIILVSITTLFASSILIEAGISYLGFISPDTASLGNILAESSIYLFSHPIYALSPGIIIVLFILSFNLISDSINNHIIEIKE